MTPIELKAIFQPQIDQGNHTLHFLLVEGITQTIHEFEVRSLEAQIEKLSNYTYYGSPGRTPTFLVGNSMYDEPPTMPLAPETNLHPSAPPKPLIILGAKYEAPTVG